MTSPESKVAKKFLSKQLLIATGALALVVAIGLLLVRNGKNEPTPSNNQTIVQEDTMRRGTDGAVEFAVNPDETRVQVAEITDGSVVSRKADAGKQFVTVFVQVKNNGSSELSLYASEQYLVTTGGKRVAADAGLQTFITNGGWYENIPADDFASGVLVFQIDQDDRVDSLELHGGLASEGTIISLQS